MRIKFGNRSKLFFNESVRKYMIQEMRNKYWGETYDEISETFKKVYKS